MAHEPWSDRVVEARSALQAEAILQRLGYECDPKTARIVASRADPPSPAAPSQLRCRRCDHELDGLTVHAAIVTCPECGFGQVLMVWHAPDDQPRELWRLLVTLLAVTGALALGLLGLMIFSAIMF